MPPPSANLTDGLQDHVNIDQLPHQVSVSHHNDNSSIDQVPQHIDHSASISHSSTDASALTSNAQQQLVEHLQLQQLGHLAQALDQPSLQTSQFGAAVADASHGINGMSSHNHV